MRYHINGYRRGPSGSFYGEALRNEYYAFQIGVFAGKNELKNVKISFSDLNGSRERIPSSSLTCFNTGGTDPYGNSFEKQVDVKSGNVQPLWIGVDIPEDITPGKYRGQVTVSPENSEPQTVDVVIKIKNEVITGRGDNEPWRHSRLRWLNSTLGIDDMPTKGYDPIEVKDNDLYILTGKEVSA